MPAKRFTIIAEDAARVSIFGYGISRQPTAVAHFRLDNTTRLRCAHFRGRPLPPCQCNLRAIIYRSVNCALNYTRQVNGLGPKKTDTDRKTLTHSDPDGWTGGILRDASVCPRYYFRIAALIMPVHVSRQKSEYDFFAARKYV